MNLRQTDKAAAAGVKRGRVRLPSAASIRPSVRPSTHLSASSHWRRALISAFSTDSNRLTPSGILMCLSAPCGGEDTSALNPPTEGGGARGGARGHTSCLSPSPWPRRRSTRALGRTPGSFRRLKGRESRAAAGEGRPSSGEAISKRLRKPPAGTPHLGGRRRHHASTHQSRSSPTHTRAYPAAPSHNKPPSPQHIRLRGIPEGSASPRAQPPR